jgi:cbb3-type cytochrome oxidase subunit 3
MLREGMELLSDTRFTMLALFLFLVTFVGIVLWTYRKSAREYYNEMARLPLDERKSK